MIMMKTIGVIIDSCISVWLDLAFIIIHKHTYNTHTHANRTAIDLPAINNWKCFNNNNKNNPKKPSQKKSGWWWSKIMMKLMEKNSMSSNQQQQQQQILNRFEKKTINIFYFSTWQRSKLLLTSSINGEKQKDDKLFNNKKMMYPFQIQWIIKMKKNTITRLKKWIKKIKDQWRIHGRTKQTY